MAHEQPRNFVTQSREVIVGNTLHCETTGWGRWSKLLRDIGEKILRADRELTLPKPKAHVVVTFVLLENPYWFDC